MRFIALSLFLTALCGQAQATCAVFDRESSSAWGGVHETEFAKDNTAPETITVDGNSYTAGTAFQKHADDWQTSSGSSSQHFVYRFKLNRASGPDPGAESGFSGLYVSLHFPVNVVATAVYGGFGAVDATPKPSDASHVYLGSKTLLIHLCAGARHYSPGDCPKTIGGARATADTMATLEVHGVRNAALAKGESHLSLMEVTTSCESEAEYEQNIWTRVPSPPPRSQQHRRAPPPPAPQMATVRVAAKAPPPPVSNSLYSYEGAHSHVDSYGDEDGDGGDVVQPLSRLALPQFKVPVQQRQSGGIRAKMNGDDGNGEVRLTKEELLAMRYYAPSPPSEDETDELLGFNVFLSPPSPSLPPAGEADWALIASFFMLDGGIGQALLLAAVGAAIVAVVRSRLGGEEDRAKRAKAARVATEEEEMSDEEEEEEDEEEEEQQPRRSARSSSSGERGDATGRCPRLAAALI